MGRRFAIPQTTLLCAITSALVVIGAASSQALAQRPHLEVTYGATTRTLYPAADAFINQYQPTRNYGASSVLKTRNEFGAGGGLGWAWQDLIEFDLSSIPSGAVISSAKMRLYYYKRWDVNPVGRDLDLYQVTESWDEATVTWDNQPAYDDSSAIATDQVPASVDTWMEWDVASSVQDIVDGSVDNYGWLLLDPDPFNQPNIPIAYFYASETAVDITDVEHYKVYALEQQAFQPFQVNLADQFGEGPVELTGLRKLGAPVSKAIAPEDPVGGINNPWEHLAWYEFVDPQPRRRLQVTNQFGTQNWSVKDGRFLLVPAIKDDFGTLQLEQHWKCYEANPLAPEPDVIVNLWDQFGTELDIVVGSGRYLCNPAQKNAEPEPPLPDHHLACYDITDAPVDEYHYLDDQFGNHPDLWVENPELLCLPSLKTHIPPPGDVDTGAATTSDVGIDGPDPGTGLLPNTKTRLLDTSETISVPWQLHVSGGNYTNVAGVIFRVHYDSNELDLLHTGSPPLFGNTTPFWGPTVMSIFPGGGTLNSVAALTSTFPQLSPSVAGSPSSGRTHVAWLSPFAVTASGATITASTPFTFATFSIHPRHTNSGTKSDVDFSVPSIWLMQHATASQTGSFSVWSPSLQFFTQAFTLYTSDIYLPISFSLAPEPGVAAHLGLEHSPCNNCALDIDGNGLMDQFDLMACFASTTPACAQWDLNGDGLVDLTDFALLAVTCQNLPLICPGGSVDHYKVYGLEPEFFPPFFVDLADQFGQGSVGLAALEKLGAPVSKAHVPDSPLGTLLRPYEHLAWYAFLESQPPRTVWVTNQFGTETWDVGNGHFLLVPATKDGLGTVKLEQHWKCYEVISTPAPPGLSGRPRRV